MPHPDDPPTDPRGAHRCRQGRLGRTWTALNTALELVADITGVGFTFGGTRRRDGNGNPPRRRR
jgi:hypothetical protein